MLDSKNGRKGALEASSVDYKLLLLLPVLSTLPLP